MEIEILNKLRRTRDGFYDLHVTADVNNKRFMVFSFICEERHNMRLDLVSNDIYKNANNVDVLMSLNGILNPFSVENGDEIFFVEDENVDGVRANDATTMAIIDAIKNANTGKDHKVDKSRLSDKQKEKERESEKRYIPPNILDVNQSNININGGKITLKPSF
jgi:hypothetical protein